MPRPSPEEQIEFLVKIQRLFSEGSFVATYKFALLQALADLSVEKGDYSGDTLRISIREIAEKFIQYYARQSLPFRSGEGVQDVLKQNTKGQALVVSQLEPFVASYGLCISSFRRDTRQWRQLVGAINRKIVEDPLWRLQKLGDECDDFIYENPCEYSNIDEITLKPGVAYNFRLFHSLIQDLIQGAWIRHVRNIKGNAPLLGDTKDLGEFLFGSDREPLKVYQPILKEIQDNNCFYCGKFIRGSGEVDHFIPWVKYPVDLGHNFVLTDSTCNSKKRSFLAAEHHLQNWMERNNRHNKDLQQGFDENRIFHDLNSSTQITCWAYEQAENAKAHVWVLGDETRPIGTYWRNLCWQESVEVMKAAE